jgi:hypothetical protein
MRIDVTRRENPTQADSGTRPTEESVFRAAGITRHRHEFLALAVGAGAPRPAIAAIRRKGVRDELHPVLLRSAERKRQAPIATPTSPTQRQQLDDLLIKGHAEHVAVICLHAPRYRSGKPAW